jgi:cation diffusion facilitator family transporter
MVASGKAIGLGILAVCVNMVLMLIKIVAGMWGNSQALIADGIESAGDIFTTLITWTGFQYSLRPADDNHPYGHGKIESLTGLFSGTALLVAAGVIAYHSIQEILAPHATPAWYTLPVLVGVVVVKELLFRRVFSLGSEMESQALLGDAWHHRSDAITSGAAAVGITVALMGGPGYEMADDCAALLACVIIVFNGARIIRPSLQDVLDTHVSGEFEESTRQRAEEVPGVVAIEKCRIRKSGIGYLVDIHVQVNGSMTVREGHEIGHAVKARLMESQPRITDVTVHLEPRQEEIG